MTTPAGATRLATVRVVLPAHLQTLAKASSEITLTVEPAPTLCRVLDALEAAYPVLQGTIRDHTTGRRRDFVRFFACEEDLSHDPVNAPLPPRVADGIEPLLIVGAIAGG